MNFPGKKMNSVYKPLWDLLQVVQLRHYGKTEYQEEYTLSPLPLQWPGKKQAFPTLSAQFLPLQELLQLLHTAKDNCSGCTPANRSYSYLRGFFIHIKFHKQT